MPFTVRFRKRRSAFVVIRFHAAAASKELHDYDGGSLKRRVYAHKVSNRSHI
jgi:hypothetical protein